MDDTSYDVDAPEFSDFENILKRSDPGVYDQNLDKNADGRVYAIVLLVATPDGRMYEYLYIGETTQLFKTRLIQHVRDELEFKKDLPQPSGADGEPYYRVSRIYDVDYIHEKEIDVDNWSLVQELSYLESQKGKQLAKENDGEFDDIAGAK